MPQHPRPIASEVLRFGEFEGAAVVVDEPRIALDRADGAAQGQSKGRLRRPELARHLEGALERRQCGGGPSRIHVLATPLGQDGHPSIRRPVVVKECDGLAVESLDFMRIRFEIVTNASQTSQGDRSRAHVAERT